MERRKKNNTVYWKSCKYLDLVTVIFNSIICHVTSAVYELSAARLFARCYNDRLLISDSTCH